MNKWYFVVHFHSYYFPPCLFLYPSYWFEGHLSEGFLFSAQGSLFCFPLAFLIVFLVAPFVLHPSSSLPLTAYSFLSGLSFSGSLSLNVFCFSILVYEIFSSCVACHAVKRGNPHFSCVCACIIASEYWERAIYFSSYMHHFCIIFSYAVEYGLLVWMSLLLFCPHSMQLLNPDFTHADDVAELWADHYFD